jgi:hypothetical protein
MHVLAAMQLTAIAGDFQLADAKLGLVFSVGGPAGSNDASALAPLRA